jgi:hypothetical protein
MNENKHEQVIPPDILEEAREKAEELRALLYPYMSALTPAERQKIPKMGETTLSFVEKSYGFAQNNPEFVPSHVSMDDFGDDFREATGLLTIRGIIKQLDRGLDDKQMVTGNHALKAALKFYGAVKMAAKDSAPGAETIFNELRPRFPQRGGHGAVIESETITETVKETITSTK